MGQVVRGVHLTGPVRCLKPLDPFPRASTREAGRRGYKSRPPGLRAAESPQVSGVFLLMFPLVFPAEQQSSKQCELPSDEAGIIWDGVCFCFLLLQRRVFRSHYFLYVVLDLQTTQLLASRHVDVKDSP